MEPGFQLVVAVLLMGEVSLEQIVVVAQAEVRGRERRETEGGEEERRKGKGEREGGGGGVLREGGREGKEVGMEGKRERQVRAQASPLCMKILCMNKLWLLSVCAYNSKQ